MSLFGDYIKEREGKHIIEDEDGFATFVYCGDGLQECYIVDIYVKPEKRKDGIASKYADLITEIARAEGCKILSGSVDPRTSGATSSLKVLLAYGFEVVGTANSLIWFKKEI